MLPLIIAPNKILRAKAQVLQLPLTGEIIDLAPQMFEAMNNYQGIGLAAPQVNKSIRLMVIATAKGPRAFINPVIKKFSRKVENMEEGCLSLPGVFGIVPRPYSISVEYVSLKGKKVTADYNGLVARVFQHEVDHLDGVLFIDKAIQITNGQEKLSKYQEV